MKDAAGSNMNSTVALGSGVGVGLGHVAGQGREGEEEDEDDDEVGPQMPGMEGASGYNTKGYVKRRMVSFCVLITKRNTVSHSNLHIPIFSLPIVEIS